MKRDLKVFFICILFFSFLSAEQKDIKDKPLNILVFQSYHPTLPWTSEFSKGIEKFQKESSRDVNFFIEGIDYIRLKEQMAPSQWEAFLKNKYKGISFDGILIESIFAANVFNLFSNTFYEDIPKVYLSYTSIENKKNAIVIKEANFDFVKKSVSLIQKQNPDLKNIYVIKADKGGDIIEKKLLEELEKRSYNIELIKDFSMAELKVRLAKLSKNSILFSILNFSDKTGKEFIPKKFIQEISKVSSVPVYSFWSTFIGTGTVGGYMIDPRIIAQNSMEVLINKIQTGKFSKSKESYQLFLDEVALKKYNLDTSSYPKGAIILNRSIPIWELYPKETFIALSMIVLLSLLSFLLIVLRIRAKKIKKIEEMMLIQSRQAAMGEMISAIAHQWRQPLNNISILIQTIILKYRKDKLDDIIMDKFKKSSSEQISYMSNTIDDFRNFYKPNRDMISFNLKDTLIKTIDLFENNLNKLGIKIIKENIVDYEMIGYPNEIAQCFLVLFQNSKDAFLESDKDGEKFIKVSIVVEDKQCILSFEDNAKGIDKSNLPKIFDPYFTTKHQSQGTGLGLYLVKVIVEKHSLGIISATNTLAGVRFDIKFFQTKKKK